MEPMIFVLLVVTIIGADEPIFTFKPSIAFDTLGITPLLYKGMRH